MIKFITFINKIKFMALVMALCVHPAFAESFYQSLPNPLQTGNSWVLDKAGILGKFKDEINQIINDFESRTSGEIAVVVIPTIGKRVPKDAAVEIFNLWGIGKKEKDNGVLILHVLDQRRIEIEVGYGLEGDLTDVKTGWILDEITVPFFREKLFGAGHLATVKGVIGVIENPAATREEIAAFGGKSASDLLAQGLQPDPDPQITPLDESLYDDTPLNIMQTVSFFTFGAGAFLLISWIMIYGAFRILKRPQPYDNYKFYNSVGGWFQYIASVLIFASPVLLEFGEYETMFSVFAGIPAAFGIPLLIRIRRLRYLRNLPRICSECGKEIPVKLSETADDAFLNSGQRTEEKIRSVDYDVWKCSCGNHMIEKYEGDIPAHDCPSCKYKTLQIVKSVTVVSATASSSGLAKDYYKCRHCNHEDVKERVIPKISSSSGSGNGSSHGGGRSFGGGSSGGGGGGRSY